MVRLTCNQEWTAAEAKSTYKTTSQPPQKMTIIRCPVKREANDPIDRELHGFADD